MSRVRNPPSPSAPSTPRVPQYAAPPESVLEQAPVMRDSAPAAPVECSPDLLEACRNASYTLLDVRQGEWQLLVFGSGANLRSFGSFEEGLAFVRGAGIENCRCLQVPGGVIR